MINITQFAPPPCNYVKSTLTRLRLGRIAAVIVLAGLAIAVGMALPNPPAAAYDGYTYTQLICQEYGQQPRWYQVRNPIPGSDWRNDGGWAIVLERGSNVSPPVFNFGAAQLQGPFSQRSSALLDAESRVGSNTRGYITSGILYVDGGTYITDQNGISGWVEGAFTDTVIDRNGDGVLDLNDITGSGGNWRWERRSYSMVSLGENYGTQYIRWANLMWCR